MSPTDLPWDPIPVPGRLFRTGGTCLCRSGIFSHVIDTDSQIDGIRPGIPGSMMETDRVCPHHLVGVDWAQNQSRYILKLIITI